MGLEYNLIIILLLYLMLLLLLAMMIFFLLPSLTKQLMLLLLLGMLIFLLPSQGTYPTSWACLFLHHPTQHCTSTLDVYICCGWAYGWLDWITAGCLGILPRSLNNTTVCGSFLTGSSASTLVQYNSWWLGSYEEKKSSQGIVVMEW